MIEIEIDGKKLEAKEGSMVIQVADEAGIYIPRFCYHKKLSIAANCRMCLVEVEKAPKALPACATPITNGMKVFTRSEKALAAQKAVMEFLLINHPLDCPICDQGGECELQDLALGYGRGVSRYTEGKRSVKDKDLGPLVASDMTRCIQCTRCVRFGDEIAGMRELGATGRGERMEIGTYIEHALQSELSGNVIDVCPVGALTSKPFRFTGRAWEMHQHEAISPHDCIGTNIYVHTRGEEYTKIRHVMRVVPRENEAINETWIADRDRYSYEGLHSEERVSKPLVKRENGEWQEIEWEQALHIVTDKLKAIIDHYGAEQIAALASPSSTVEEFYLLQKLIRSLGSHNIDHRIRIADFRNQNYAPIYPSLGVAIADLEKLNTLLLVGADVRHEQPIANARIRKMLKLRGKIMCINPVDYDYNFSFAIKQIVDSAHLVTHLAHVAKALFIKNQQDIPNDLAWLLANLEPDQTAQLIAENLQAGEKAAVIFGLHAVNHPDAAILHALGYWIAKLSQASFGAFSEGANSAGAWLAGAVPHRLPAGAPVNNAGLNAGSMFENQRQAYVLLNVEPELDCAFAHKAKSALMNAQCVISLASFVNSAMKEYVDVILPIAAFTENSGTFVNIEGRWQSYKAMALPLAEARPAWKVLRVLGNFLDLEGFDFNTEQEILAELNLILNEQQAPEKIYLGPEQNNLKADTIHSILQWPMYRVDNLVRHAAALQKTMTQDDYAVRLNSKLATALKLLESKNIVIEQNGAKINLAIIIDERIADNQVMIPMGIEATSGFGDPLAEIKLEKIS